MHIDPTCCRSFAGLGPAGLELDRSGSGRVWKPSLRQYGIDAPRLEATEHGLSPADFSYMLQALVEHLEHAAKEAAVVDRFKALKPVFAAWPAVAAEVEASSCDRSAEALMDWKI